MIVLLDVNSRNIKLYTDNGLQVIPFSEAPLLKHYTQDNDFYYVTNVMETKADQVINLIDSMSPQPNTINTLTGNLYIYSNTDKILCIPNLNMKFEGKFDFKLYDKDMQKLVKSSPILVNLLNKNDLKIIDERTKRVIVAEKKIVQQKEKEKRSKRDEQLDSIIIQDSASGSAVDYAASASSSGMFGDDGAIDIDLTNEIKNL